LVTVARVITSLFDLDQLGVHFRTGERLVRLSEHSNRCSKRSGNDNGLNKGFHG
jgi:hypothetical protein